MMGLGESGHGLVILFVRTEHLRELRRGQELPISWTFGVIKVFQELLQDILVPQRKN
jgi:hypothetical protein